jgi:hypothetical protein
MNQYRSQQLMTSTSRPLCRPGQQRGRDEQEHAAVLTFNVIYLILVDGAECIDSRAICIHP